MSPLQCPIAGCSRKAKVCKRQLKNRETPSFKARKRKAETTAANEDPKKRASVTSNNDDQGQTSSSQTDPQAEKSSSLTPSATTVETSKSDTPPPNTSSTDATAKPTEDRQRLGLQVRCEPLKSVSLIQTLAKARKDQAPRFKELDLFWVQMDAWETLDHALVEALKNIRAEWIAKCSNTVYLNSPNFIRLLVRVHNSCNGITNCLQHVVGTMLKLFVDNSEEDSTATVIDEVTDCIDDLQYDDYTALLKACECDLCNDVLLFDDTYTR